MLTKPQSIFSNTRMLPFGLKRVQSVITVCLAIQILIAHQLWTSSNRAFPLISAIGDFSPILPSWLDYGLFSLLILSLFAAAFLVQRSDLRILVLGLIFLFIFLDINRLQIWLYQLAAMLLVIALYRKQNEAATFSALRLIICCVYFWAGLNKLNIHYYDLVFPWLMSKSAWTNQGFVNEYSNLFATLTAAFEAALGLVLIFPKLWRVGTILVAAFHLSILLLLSPLIHHWNEVVWAWNVAMILMVYLLFYNAPHRHTPFQGIFKNAKIYPASIIILMLFLFAPALNLLNSWDEQLSIKMYSGVNPECIFYFGENDVACLPDTLKNDYFNTGKTSIILDDWTFKELKTPPYASRRTFLKIGKHLCNCTDYSEEAGIKIFYYSRWSQDDETMEDLPCSLLLEN